MYELDAGHLAGRLVWLCRCLVDLEENPWIELEGKTFPLHLVDPVKNSRRARPARKKSVADRPANPTHFDPARALLDKAVGRVQAVVHVPGLVQRGLVGVGAGRPVRRQLPDLVVAALRHLALGAVGSVLLARDAARLEGESRSE